MNVRIQPRWTFTEVRRAAVALSRAVERRVPALASSKWWKEERHGVFLDYNQNAKDRTTCSAYSVRPLPDARVSTPLHWDEVPDCEPADFTILTVPQRFARDRRSARGHGCRAGLARKVAWNSRTKTKPRASPMRPGRRTFARWRAKRRAWRLRAPRPLPKRKAAATKMPLLVVANSPDKEAALAGLERWKSKHPEAAGLLAVDDVLVDSMRGRSSTWTRIRVNLRHVPEDCGRRRKRPTPMTIRRANGGERSAPQEERAVQRVSGRRRKSRPAPAAEPLRAGHKCNRPAFCRCAICGNAPCAGSELPCMCS